MNLPFTTGLPSCIYRTDGGISVRRRAEQLPYADAIEPMIDALDSRRGALFTSSFEYPGRYTRWDMGFVDPPAVLSGCGRSFCFEALNERGSLLLAAAVPALTNTGAVTRLVTSRDSISGVVPDSGDRFPEEQRSRQAGVFSVLRVLVSLFAAKADLYLGFYGAFGYDLAFQFEPIRKRLSRAPEQRDLVLYLPDEIVIVDHRRETATRYLYEFAVSGRSTEGLPRRGAAVSYLPGRGTRRGGDHEAGAYAAVVRRAIAAFERGDLFEVVPSQTFHETCPVPPSTVFRRLRRRNPAPYGALINLGEAEYLVSASPEMYVRAEGRRIETCPISGTISRGRDAIDDAEQIRTLINSGKDESELTMCTDVDRNDKSRVCVPGSVRIIGRRQIEMYSRLIHTVDHVEGILSENFDALDAFLAHAWAVTVTGAPKRKAMQFIEDNERSPRCWYGGAIGFVGFNGSMNTGLTLRTARIKDGLAEVRAGATLLFESDPADEERETRLKAAALLDAILRSEAGVSASSGPDRDQAGAGKQVLIVDHEDSFVHTLAALFRQTGAQVRSYRSRLAVEQLRSAPPDLVVLSPGPGRPQDFSMNDTVRAILDIGAAAFGVCLGLQGLVEYFGGQLVQLPIPMHGKSSAVRVLGGALFQGLPPSFRAGRYHSLIADRESLPSELLVTAESDEGLVLAVEHRSLPLTAVQFHPESLMTLDGDCGLRLVRNVMSMLPR